MADIEYSVVAKLQAQGAPQFKGDMGAAAQAASKLQDGLKGIGAHLYEFGAGAIGAAAKVTSIAAAMGTAAAVAAAGYIGKNLSLLEDKSIQMGAVIGAATSTSFQAAKRESDVLFEKFKKDAVSSAGETKDFVNVAANIAGPLLGAGKSMEDLHRITKGVIQTAPALGATFEQAGTDVMRMLQGGAGAELPFFKALTAIPSLGIKSAEVFNKWPVEKRIKAVEDALTNPAFQAAAVAAGNSFTGLKSTIEDQLKAVGGAILGPSYEAMKRGMQKWTAGVMTLLDSSGFQQRMERYGHVIAGRISNIAGNISSIFPKGEEGASSFLDTIMNIADRGLGKIQDASLWVKQHWVDISSTVEKVAGGIAKAASKAEDMVRALGGGDFAKGAERAAIGGMAIKTAMPLAPAVMKAGSSLLGAAGGEGAAGSAGGAAGAAAGIGTGAMAAAAAGVVAIGAAAFLTLKSNFMGIGDWLDTRFSRLKDAALNFADAASTLGERLYGVFQKVAPILGVPIIAWLGVMANMLTNVMNGAAWLASGLGWLIIQINGAKDAITGGLTNALDGWIKSIDETEAKLKSTQNAFYSFIMLIGDLGGKLVETADKIAGVFGLTVHSNGTLSPTDDTTKRTFEVSAPTAVGLMAQAYAAPKGLNKPNPPAGGAGQKIEVVLKVDLGDPNEDAIFIRSRKDFERAFDEAKNRARILTSPLPGVT